MGSQSLESHSGSIPWSCDAGYGLATILEVLSSIKDQNRILENDIQVLITDAEELGLLGAQAEMNKNPEAFKNVRLVINIEARGVKGPAVMFETGLNNTNVMNYYINNANNPFSYSFATDIYRMMPNGTDFTVFIQNNFTGYNFAVLDSLDYYHTKKDNFGNISLSSVQHYGSQIYPIVEKFVYTPEGMLPDFKLNISNTFFNILPGVIIGYPQIVTLIQLLLSVMLFLIIVIISFKRKEIRLSKIIVLSAGMLGAYIISAVLGTLTAFIM